MKKGKIHKSERSKAAAVAQMAYLLLTDPSLSEDQRDELRRYFADEQDPEFKKETLEALFTVTLQQARASRSSLTPVSSKEIEQRWAQLATGLGMNPDLKHYRAADVPSLRPARRFELRRVALRVAAVLIPAMMLVGGGYLWYERSSRVQEGVLQPAIPALPFVADNTVEADEVRQVTLPDGTEVTLNRHSTLSYNDSREVKLQGEAYFKVTKDPEHPFIIHSDHLTVTVLGTEFNFDTQTADGTSQLSLYEGVVKLDYDGKAYRLDEAGHEFTLDHATAQASIRTFDHTAKPQWMGHEVRSQIMSLGEIFDRIERTYGVTITGREAVDTGARFNFVLDGSTSLESVMTALEYAAGTFGHRIDGTTITLDEK